MKKKEIEEIVEKELESKREAQNKELEDLDVLYNKKLEYVLAQEQNIFRKEMVELVEVFENNVLSG